MEERTQSIYRAKMKIKSHKEINDMDSSDYIKINYNINGLVTSYEGSDQDMILYQYNDKGRKIRCFQLFEGKPQNIYIALYRNDTTLSKVIWYHSADYLEEVYYDSTGLDFRRLKIYRNVSRIDSTIKLFDEGQELEIEFENGKPILLVKTFESKRSKIEKYYHFIGNDTLHYLTWTYIFDRKGREVKRTQIDKNEITEYLKHFKKFGNKQISVVKTNGMENFRIINEFKQGKIIKSTHIEKNYKNISTYHYLKNGLDWKSKSKTFKNGKLTETEEWRDEFTFY
jgi:hypothetical protein